MTPGRLDDRASARRDFVVAHTAIAAPPAVPEIRLHLATEVTPLWHASAASFEAEGIEPPYWAFAWAGGQALARYLLDTPTVVAGKAVADVGAGSGLVGLAAKRAGAARVTALDVDPVAIAACGLNAAVNDLAIECIAGDAMAMSLDAYDVVLIGDLFYEEGPAKRVHAWAERLARDGKTVLAGDPGRAYLPPGLVEIAAMDLPTSLDLEGRTSKRTAVYRIG